MKYMTTLKSEIRLSLDKAMSGGKKKGKGGKGAAAAPEAPKENCIIAIGSTFPEFQQQILELLNQQPWDANGAIVGTEYVTAVRTAIPDKKKQGLAMKFAAFVVKEATEVGKEQALAQSMPFSETETISAKVVINTVIPCYWILENRLQCVFHYSYDGSGSPSSWNIR